MTKTVIMMDSICTMFNKILEKLIFKQDYDIKQFNIDLQYAVIHSMSIIKIQNKKYVQQELIEVLNRQICRILMEMIDLKRDKEEFWLKV